MGGDIQVDSRRGMGNTFSFELDVATSEWTSRVETPSETAALSYRGPKRRVLVVDDVPENRAVLISALEAVGFDVREATSGHDGIALAQSLLPDLIVMDIVMPDIGGVEVIQQLRKIPRIEAIPIVVVSASATPEVEASAMAVGANSFLRKPVNLKDLMQCTARLLHIAWIDGAQEQRGSPGRVVA